MVSSLVIASMMIVLSSMPTSNLGGSLPSQTVKQNSTVITGAEVTVDAAYSSWVSNELNNTPVFGETGTAGRVSIPAFGYSSKLYIGDGSSYDQSIVDGADSSALCTPDRYVISVPMIADHVHQGFSCIEEVEIGYTKMYITHDNGSYETYVATDRLHATANDPNYVFVDDYGQDPASRWTTGINTYTCSPHWPNVCFVHWERCD